MESKEIFDTQGTILFHLNDYVAIKNSKTEDCLLTPAVSKFFDVEINLVSKKSTNILLDLILLHMYIYPNMQHANMYAHAYMP